MKENPPPALDAIDLRTFIRTFVNLPLMGLKTNNFALFRIVASEMMVNEELRKLYYQQILEPTLALAEVYLHEQAPKLGLSQVKIQLTIRTISGMILGLMLEYAMGDNILATQWEELPDFLADFIVKGLIEA